MQPQHFGIEPPPFYWPTEMQAKWWRDFAFIAGAEWGEPPMRWYLDQLGDA